MSFGQHEPDEAYLKGYRDCEEWQNIKVSALRRALEQIRDAHPTGLSWSQMNDGTWREACRDMQRIARLALADAK